MIENRKARYDYFIENTLECGISLYGNEVKSIRDGQCSIKEAWASIQNNQLVLRGMHITPWSTSNKFDIDEDRERILLVHKNELLKLKQSIEKDGVTLVPTKVYFNDTGKCKIELGICRGKKKYDKRESIKQRDIKREMERGE